MDDLDFAEEKASRPPLIEAFGITGLHGYRTISVEAGHAATILIAKNGSGKTTLLGVLNAFLLGQFVRLRGLEFETVFCKLRGMPDQLVLSRSDLEEALIPPETGELYSLSARIGVQPAQLFKFVMEDWASLRLNRDEAYESPTYTALAREFGYGGPRVDKVIDDLYLSIYSQNNNVAHIIRSTRNVLGSCDVLYLPTYRRVELALRGAANDARHRRKKPRFDISPNGLFTGDIQFGLSDISDRLREINEKIVYDSNNQYRKISADIINGLIDGTYENAELFAPSIPKEEDLELLFSRVEQGRRVGPHFPVTVPNLKKIYSKDGVPKSSEKFLNYFLGQLDKVINSTREVESRVQEFVDKCNYYLSLDEISTRLGFENSDKPIDAKKLVLNKRTLQVQVVSVPGDRRISLDALSSGEKQMISLFAKLYLYEARKIVLVDEPELSLSIEWQRRILVDVLSSPLCEQLVAITHSPFVFDNELDAYAGSLRVSSTPKTTQDISDDVLFEEDNFDE
ncbi:AAA family ATPase [Brevundimonas sp.]|uniref:AAA family ATPase n=1 Tax=Brevundimonas sp. TaxID=1871086 RepID=UPI00289D6079|nr:AAA family ATPase [Brevundimonas sp.]